MGIELVAALALGVAAAGAYEGYEARKDAKEAAAKGLEEQKKSNAEQRAMNAQSQAEEQRKQVREERVRRARILQASANSGTEGSSGEAGALGGLATGLASNLGFNASRAAAADRMSIFNQNAADYGMQQQNSMLSAQNWDSLTSLSMSIFSASGGFGGGGKKAAATTT